MSDTVIMLKSDHAKLLRRAQEAGALAAQVGEMRSILKDLSNSTTITVRRDSNITAAQWERRIRAALAAPPTAAAPSAGGDMERVRAQLELLDAAAEGDFDRFSDWRDKWRPSLKFVISADGPNLMAQALAALDGPVEYTGRSTCGKGSGVLDDVLVNDSILYDQEPIITIGEPLDISDGPSWHPEDSE